MNQTAVIEPTETLLEKLHRQHKERQARKAEAVRRRVEPKSDMRTFRPRGKLSTAELRERGRKQLRKWKEEGRRIEAFKEKLKEDRIAQLQIQNRKCMELTTYETAEKYSDLGITLADLFSERRDKISVLARNECFWRARTETTHTLPTIGRYYGGRDHTTVLHGVRRYMTYQQYILGNVTLPDSVVKYTPFHKIIKPESVDAETWDAALKKLDPEYGGVE